MKTVLWMYSNDQVELHVPTTPKLCCRTAV